MMLSCYRSGGSWIFTFLGASIIIGDGGRGKIHALLTPTDDGRIIPYTLGV
jgi:hypothetical protein